jgi:hypothetical protein
MSSRARIDLAALDEAFALADVPSAASLPDGPYLVEVALVELRATRQTARPMLCWTLRVLSGPFAARRLWRNQVLGPGNLGWLKKDLRLCGLELPKLSDLPGHLARLHGIRLEVIKQTRGDYQAVLFRRRARDSEA